MKGPRLSGVSLSYERPGLDSRSCNTAMHLRWVVRPQSPLHLPLSVFAAPIHSCLHRTGMTPDVDGVSTSDPWLSGVPYFCITLMVSIHHAAHKIAPVFPGCQDC